MMKKVVLGLAVLMTVVLLDAPASAATKVFLLGGQSNMAGVGGYNGYALPPGHPWDSSGPPWNFNYPGADDPCPAPYHLPQAAVKFWNYSDGVSPGSSAVHDPATGNAWINLQNGYGYRGDQFGPELSFGYRLHELYPDDEIYLVKYGISSTSLAVDWNPNGSGPMYNNFKARVNAALQNLILHGKNPTIAGMLWMQGENDVTNHTHAMAYQSNLINLINHVRNDFVNADDLKFVIGRITTMPAYWGTMADANTVRNAQQNVPALVGNAAWIDTDGLELAYYEHYGTQGQVDLGIRFANEFTPVPEPSSILLLGCSAAVGLLFQSSKRRNNRCP
jgi:hypothetical protein